MDQDDLAYYRFRAATELDLAMRAAHPRAVAAHDHLALQYLLLIRGGPAGACGA
jgi:hypothetical protein